MKKRRLALIWTALTLVVLASALTAATYAWFTFDPYTKVTPIEGKISDGDSNLLISESRDGPFERKCDLNPVDLAETLLPVSTSDLTRFYASAAQDREGYSIAFRDVSDSQNERLIHGTVYLKSLGNCDVFFKRPALDLGTDPQVLAAGRLGLKITGGDGETKTFLFRLDFLGSTEGTEKRPTVYAENAVVGGISDGAPVFSEDLSESIGDYIIDADGTKILCTMEPNEIAAVEYWLYLEGCDTECFNPVQSRNVVLQLGFAGNPKES